MIKKFSTSNYSLKLPFYHSLYLTFLLILRLTPFNRCGTNNSLFIGCIGFLDILTGLSISPGLFFWFLLLNIPPTSFVLKPLSSQLNKLGLHDFLILLIFGWILSLLVFAVAGRLVDNKKRKK